MRMRKTYGECYETILANLREKARELEGLDWSQATTLLYSAYHDPDSYSVRERAGVECTSDGIVSIKRLFAHEQSIDDVVEAWATLRRVPLVWWPSEICSINVCRCRTFGDRIDATFHDLHRYLLGMTCRMGAAYTRHKTAEWLDSFKADDLDAEVSAGEVQWRALVDWMGVKGWLVDDEYHVFDLEAGDGSVIDLSSDYPAAWSDYQWSDIYYRHVCQAVAVASADRAAAE